MIRTIVGLALAGIALTPFAEKADRAVAAQQISVDPFETASMKPDSRMVFEAATALGGHCQISVNWGTGRVKTAQAENACAQVHPGLETISAWSDALGGTVRLQNAKGAMVLEIGASDGFAYESISADVEPVTFTRIES